MAEKVGRNHFVVFGLFDFPPTPEVTISLLQLFLPLALMPSVVQMLDPANGKMLAKTALSNAKGLQIIFSNDRIDIVETAPVAPGGAPTFIERAREYLKFLESRNLKYSRVAVVREVVYDGYSEVRLNEIQKKILPLQELPALEWNSRAVAREKIGDVDLNVCMEIGRQSGFLQRGTQIEKFNGLRLASDVSTLPEDVSLRYSNENLNSVTDLLLEAIRRHESFIESL